MAVHEIGNQLVAEIDKKKQEREPINNDFLALVADTKGELNEMIEKNNSILCSNDATALLGYETKNQNFRSVPKQEGTCPTFQPGFVEKDALLTMFCFMHISVHNIQSPYASYEVFPKLDNLHCIGSEIWLSGSNRLIQRINRAGTLLQKISTVNRPLILASNLKKELIFAFVLPNTKVYILKNNKIQTLMDLDSWCPVGVCCTMNGDLFISMRSIRKGHSRVLKYAGTKETLNIQYNNKGKALFSINVSFALHLAENRNRDICIADYGGRNVVVLDALGRLRFNYRGTFSNKGEKSAFKPSHFATDVKYQMVVSDIANNIVHLIDCNGAFLRYLGYHCTGGLSLDIDGNLVIGDLMSGKIKVIRYLGEES
ncbi:uncharacterized protein LOC133174586 [Saccostrea echinata]|uniref:uncharacterized protein LOC133174586 n=1 Tax=Saccostrea echinata TaxID=191078 RepID=UPI002A81178B|nr:uncharacterized protein LOC133174586 [Saccostrea echinata]